MNQSFKLYRLQQLDSQLDRERARLKEIENALSRDAELRQAETELETASQSLQAARVTLRSAEYLVQAQRAKIEQTEAALYGGKVRNPKELQDLQNESAALKRYLVVLEDRQLEAMLELEDAENLHESARVTHDKTRIRVQKQNASLLAEQATLLKEIEHQEIEYRAATGGILPKDLQLYQQLRRTRGGVAVALVTDQACSVCGSILNAALLSAVRSPASITHCATCGRILYIS